MSCPVGSELGRSMTIKTWDSHGTQNEFLLGIPMEFPWEFACRVCALVLKMSVDFCSFIRRFCRRRFNPWMRVSENFVLVNVGNEASDHLGVESCDIGGRLD